jgi:two-component system, NtrC family, response regulator AtoC
MNARDWLLANRQLDNPVDEQQHSKDEALTGEVCFVAASSVMQQVRMQAELVADLNVPVLLLGESGTGKEVTAKLIHKLSSRSASRFLKVNCAAFPSELLESELFGYERGAFTGAMRTKIGKFELCDKGTILLDEIGEMPTPLQAKLLHVLQDSQFSRLGGNQTIRVDVRILAATNVDVHQAMAERRLREDLYYRLSAFSVQLPPLRARSEEIPVLLDHFMRRNAQQYGRSPRSFSPAVLNACVEYDWPGNLRELENFVRRYFVIGDEGIAISELRSKPANGRGSHIGSTVHQSNATFLPVNGNGGRASLKSLVREAKNGAEIQALVEALENASWNRRRAAKTLNISYRALLYKIQQHRLKPFNGSGTVFGKNNESQ